MNKDRHLILVSADAFVYEDLEYVKDLPNFKRILDNGARIEKVRTIYPTITHPVHATLLTGAPAGVHGVINNARFIPGETVTPWYNRLDEIKCDTILHAAKRAGLTTAACLFPLVMGFSRIYFNVHYFSDVICGWCLGVIIALLFSEIFKKVIKND